MSPWPIPRTAPTGSRCTETPLPVEAVVSWATTPGAGAVVRFLGVVRDHADGRDGVVGMDYEAYEDEARRVLAEIVAEARRRWPDVERVALLHRIGELALSEASVAVVVSSPHRRRGVRRGAVLHRHAEGDRADLEAGALVRRLRLGARRAADPAGRATVEPSPRAERDEEDARGVPDARRRR